MTALDEIKKWMEFYGWKNGGNPGSVKMDANDKVCAIHGDATWIKDVEEACAAAERVAIVAEIERRELIRAGSAKAPIDRTEQT